MQDSPTSTVSPCRCSGPSLAVENPVASGHSAGRPVGESDLQCSRCAAPIGPIKDGEAIRLLRLAVERPDSPDAQRLIAQLDAGLARLYPPDAMFGLHPEDHDGERLVFLVARVDGQAVACGALRSLGPEVGEVKRMYVVPELRGAGVSRAMLRAVEGVAAARGHRVLRLETGKLSPPALGLYRSSGYREIPLYGEYVGGAFSLCFEKALPK